MGKNPWFHDRSEDAAAADRKRMRESAQSVQAKKDWLNGDDFNEYDPFKEAPKPPKKNK